MKKSRKSLKKLIMLAVLCVSVITTMSLATLSVFAGVTTAYGDLYGDINDDGIVNQADLTLINNYLANPTQYPLSDVQKAAADVDMRGDADEYDSEIISSYISGAIKSLPTRNVIATTSDVHSQSAGIPNLNSWLSRYAGVTSLFDHFIFGGDYDTGFNDTNADVETSCVTAVKNSFPNTSVLMSRGNHDSQKQYYTYNQQNYNYATGLVVNPATNNYAVYVMDINVSNPGSPAFKDNDISALGSILDTTPSYVPFIVVSHLPLHSYYNSANNYLRQYDSQATFINMLNQHSNVIFLWGHNHSQNDPSYGTPISPNNNATINYAYNSNNGTYLTSNTINFTYAPMGGMLDGAGSNMDRYGAVLTLDRYYSNGSYNCSYVQYGLFGKPSTDNPFGQIYNYFGVYIGQ